MITKTVIIKNESGLHARPASVFVNIAKSFESKISVRKLDKPGNLSVNAKSIVKILSEGMQFGTKIEIIADGTDEIEAVTKLCDLIENGINEG